MDILLNDNSIRGQFTDEAFLNYMRTEILPILKQLEEINAQLLKEYATYNKKVTREKTLLDFIHERGNPIIDKWKIYLVQLSATEPYWNDNIKTKENKEYMCDIATIPNCITEAYERGGMLFSFLEGGYSQEYADIKCDNEEKRVRNFITFQGLNSHLSDLGLIISWKSNSFYVSSIGYKFEIRFNEEHHNKAHFHLSSPEEAISLSIPDADVLAGGVKKSTKNHILEPEKYE